MAGLGFGSAFLVVWGFLFNIVSLVAVDNKTSEQHKHFLRCVKSPFCILLLYKQVELCFDRYKCTYWNNNLGFFPGCTSRILVTHLCPNKTVVCLSPPCISQYDTQYIHPMCPGHTATTGTCRKKEMWLNLTVLNLLLSSSQGHGGQRQRNAQIHPEYCGTKVCCVNFQVFILFDTCKDSFHKRLWHWVMNV